MDLILLRHGKAEDAHPQGDAFRALTEKGFEQARHQAARLAGFGKPPDIVLTSPLTRARQTADTFCNSIGLPGPLVQSWISPGMKPETALQELSGFSEFNRVAIVGHEPDLSRLISTLLGSNSTAIQMKKACLACLSLQPPSKQAKLKYLIPASL